MSSPFQKDQNAIDRLSKLELIIDKTLAKQLVDASWNRGLTPEALVLRIVRIALSDNLLNAILDD